jgi:hypothetical protein
VIEFGDEFHLWWGEWVRRRDLDVDFVCAACIRCVRWTREGSDEVQVGIVDEFD